MVPSTLCSGIGMFEHTGSDIDGYRRRPRLGAGRPRTSPRWILQAAQRQESPNTFINHYVFPDGELTGRW